MERNSKNVLGYRVDLLSFDEAVLFVLSNMDKNQGMQIVTINPEIIELANKSKEYSDILKNAELVIPDGSGIKLALKLKGISQEQIPGIDFTKELIKKCANMNYSVALIGAKEEIVNLAAENLKKEFPNLNICYIQNGYFNKEYEENIINNLSIRKPKLVLAALGAPKQELFINKCRKEIKESVFIGVGGSFDIWAGSVERAPEIFRKTGFEWLYRTLTQPQRIKRIYKTLPMFLFKVIIEAIQKK